MHARWFLLLAVVVVAGISAVFLLQPERRKIAQGKEQETPVPNGSRAMPPAGTAPADSRRTGRAPDEQRKTLRGGRGSTMSRLLPNGRTRGPLSKSVIHDFVEASGRSAPSLLVAWQESGDRAYLREAAERFPSDPRVQFAMIADPDSAAERASWIAAFRRSAPDNALPDYFAAISAFATGNEFAAGEALARASQKPMADYIWDLAAGMEALYLAGGVPAAEAKAMASFSMLLPHLAQLRELGERIGETQERLRDAGNVTAADNLLAARLTLGQTVSDSAGSTLIHRLVGIAIERTALENVSVNATVSIDGSSPAKRLTELQALREQIMQATRAADITAPNWSDAEIIEYLDITRMEGELAALQWLSKKKPPSP